MNICINISFSIFLFLAPGAKKQKAIFWKKIKQRSGGYLKRSDFKSCVFSNTELLFIVDVSSLGVLVFNKPKVNDFWSLFFWLLVYCFFLIKRTKKCESNKMGYFEKSFSVLATDYSYFLCQCTTFYKNQILKKNKK